MPEPIRDRFTDTELADLLTEVLFSIDPDRDREETRRKVDEVIARRAEIEATNDDDDESVWEPPTGPESSPFRRAYRKP